MLSESTAYIVLFVWGRDDESAEIESLESDFKAAGVRVLLHYADRCDLTINRIGRNTWGTSNMLRAKYGWDTHGFDFSIKEGN